jgi:plasmid maintenance system antidote protein VapI
MLIAGENMNLKDYLYLKRMTINEFSEFIGYSRNHMSGIINGRLKPTKKFAQYIEKMTNGEVKTEDLLKGQDGKD